MVEVGLRDVGIRRRDLAEADPREHWWTEDAGVGAHHPHTLSGWAMATRSEST